LLKEPLDVCFRVNSIDKHSQRTLNLMNSKIEAMLKDEETKGRAPTKVPWYPNQMAYCFEDLSRLEMRKSPVFKDFHRFIVDETENGRIFRQEKVSMIPVTLL
jgi:multisite-specific tRNA:(cytosine-C5)-methyltransferase